MINSPISKVASSVTYFGRLSMRAFLFSAGVLDQLYDQKTISKSGFLFLRMPPIISIRSL